MSVKLGIVATEAFRLLRTNSGESAYEAQVRFFRSKLIQRGFDPDQIDGVLQRYPWSRRASILADRKQGGSPASLVPFKVRYFAGAESLQIGFILNKFKFMLGPKADSGRLLACYLSSPNLFRSRFDRFF